MGNENSEEPRKPIPKINVGQYEGTPIDKLPVRYCRWMLMQDFPKEWLEIAKAKCDASPQYKGTLVASKHAIDRFSVRFLHLWTWYKVECGMKEYEGIATFVVKLAEEAWEKGVDVSKNRHKDDGIVKEYKDIKFVFDQGKVFTEYRELITVM